MKMVFRLALSNLRYHKSRTMLTGIAIMLTTMLLTAIGTSAIALLDMNRQLVVAQTNYHAALGSQNPGSFLSCRSISMWNLYKVQKILRRLYTVR